MKKPGAPTNILSRDPLTALTSQICHAGSKNVNTLTEVQIPRQYKLVIFFEMMFLPMENIINEFSLRFLGEGLVCHHRVGEADIKQFIELDLALKRNTFKPVILFLIFDVSIFVLVKNKEKICQLLKSHTIYKSFAILLHAPHTADAVNLRCVFGLDPGN